MVIKDVLLLKFSKSFCAWGLPSELSLSGRGCNCGSCLVSEEFSKDALPEWIDWRQKKEIVLGFGIFDKDLSVQLYELDSFGGFSVIRMMSSGKLEFQTFCVAWEFLNNSEAHKGSLLHFEDSLLYAIEETDGLSANTELELHCNKVMQVANEVAASTSGSRLHNEHVVSLADDTKEMCYVSQNEKLYSLHEPVAFSGKFSTIDPTPGSFGWFHFGDRRSSNYEIFDTGLGIFYRVDMSIKILLVTEEEVEILCLTPRTKLRDEECKDMNS
ncbi:unnamed protein product [Ilex paraguariensis]|uniref:F-box protein n=1 Tax=Ilex paraguariensis TaxID=185542 RepID=A0ABC8TII2_9AQUA